MSFFYVPAQPKLSMSPKFRVYRNLVDVDDMDYAKIDALVHRDGTFIFNPDKRRWQTRIRAHLAFHKKFVRALEGAGIARGRTVGNMFALHSKKGCQQQQWHYDFDPDLLWGIRKKPLGALLALEEGTKLAVHGIGDVLLQRGDCLVFDGDLVHAGSAYPDAPNTRVHVYLDVPTVERVKNRTWFFLEED